MRNSLASLLGDKRLRYILIGGSSAVFEYISFILLNYLLSNIILANVISFIIGLLYSFLLHRGWTFSGGSHRHNPSSQLLSYAILALVNVVLTSILIGFQVGTMNVPPFIAKLVCMALVVCWNYLLLNKVIFVKVKNQ